MKAGTREERKREKRKLAIRTVLALFLIAALFFLAAGMDKPPERNVVAEGAATYAAGREYERAMDLYGDEITAGQMAAAKYEEVMEQWQP